ncbi:MAG: hypothetical protein WD035_10075, partial [Balneolaceae bacterium]
MRGRSGFMILALLLFDMFRDATCTFRLCPQASNLEDLASDTTKSPSFPQGFYKTSPFHLSANGLV